MSEKILIGVLVLLFYLLTMALNLHPMFCVTLVVYVLIVFRHKKHAEMYDDYSYAKIRGRAMGGSVYTAYPENVPGLGWIL